jgi:branched-subunit amino acid transport protein
LQLAVPAIFAAIVIPLVVLANGQFDFALCWPHMLAAIATGGVAWWRGGMLLPLAAGMGTLYALVALSKI